MTYCRRIPISRSMIVRASSIMLIAIMLISMITLTSCQPRVVKTGIKVRVTALKGPTGIGLSSLMNQAREQKTANDYAFDIVATADEAVARVVSGQTDMAALPTNLAAALYQKTNQQIRLLVVNTLGVLSVLEKGETVKSINDLSGKTIQVSGQGAVPEYALNHLIRTANLAQQPQITFVASHEELAAAAIAGRAQLVLLPEPFATLVLTREPAFRRAIDLSTEWKKVHSDESGGELAMGCIVVSAEFARKQMKAVDAFLKEYEQSTAEVNRNPQKAGEWSEDFGILGDAALIAKAVPGSHIVFYAGAKARATLEPFLKVLFQANPKSIGGKLPDDGFYTLS